jgi:hypothetical protein
MRRNAAVIWVIAVASLTVLAPARASTLSVGTVRVRFGLERGFHPKPSTRVLRLVYSQQWGGCDPGPPAFAGYALLWQPHRLVVTLLVRPQPTPAPRAGIVCAAVDLVEFRSERITLPHALGHRALLDGSTVPPQRVRVSPFTPPPQL